MYFYLNERLIAKDSRKRCCFPVVVVCMRRWKLCIDYFQALRSGVGTAKKSRSGSPAQNKQYLSTSILDDPEKSFHMNLDMQCFDTPDRPQPKLTNSDGTVSDIYTVCYVRFWLSKINLFCFPWAVYSPFRTWCSDTLNLIIIKKIY